MKKVKIEINDEDGNKITLSFQGNIPRDKVVGLLDLIELMGASPNPSEPTEFSHLSKYEKLRLVVNRRFPIGWFTSQEVLVAYEDTLSEPIGLSTVSTYLARLTESGYLSRSGSRVNRQYKIKRTPTAMPGKRQLMRTPI